MQVPEVKGEVQKESLWGSRMRYAKIGAAAVGGGALLAVTGDLLPMPKSTRSKLCKDLINVSGLVHGTG